MQALVESSETQRSARLRRSLRRTNAWIVGVYAYETFLLIGFWAIGLISSRITLTFALAALVMPIVMTWAHLTGRSARFKDPTLFVPQYMVAIVMALCLAFVAPQIAFQPFATLFGATAFAFLAPGKRSFYICWGLPFFGAALVIYLVGPRLSMPTATPEARMLTWFVIVGVLARWMGIAKFARGAKARINRKNHELKQALERIEFLANRDELTRLANRRSVMRWLEAQMELSTRTAQPLCVALMDIDYFKQINDDFGHLTGDEVLRAFADVAASTMRATDCLGRYGGEEFLIVLPSTSAQAARDPLERLRDKIASRDWSSIEPKLRVTVTVGATTFRPRESMQELLKRADTALYLGKKLGRDRVLVDETE